MTIEFCGERVMKRREFLKASAASAACFSMSGLTLAMPKWAEAAQTTRSTINLVAEVAQKTVATAATGATANVLVPVWQFRDQAAPGPGLLASGIVGRTGDTITISLTNTLDRPINFVIPGMLETSTPVAPGSSGTIAFVLRAPGSYFYTDGANGQLGRAMGLVGPLVVLPQQSGLNSLLSNPAVAPNAPAAPNLTLFDQQYTLLLHEMDSRLNSAIASGGTFDMATYEPNYFFINGLSYPATKSDPTTFIKMALAEVVAIRFINAGLIYYPMHFHGYHVDVVLRNRTQEKAVVSKDSVLVSVGECVDTLLEVNQVGAYPLHSHYMPAVTANGVYPFGNMLLLQAS